MRESDKSVAFVVPCLNEHDTLALVLTKINKVRASDFKDRRTELIVCDNGSTDDSIKIAQAHGAKVVHCVQQGYGAALLRAIELAAWTVPGLIILAVLGAGRQWGDKRVRVFAASAMVTFLGYFLFKFDQGHGWGYRYFHGAWGTLPLLACGPVAGKRNNAHGAVAPVAHLAATLAVLSFALLNGLRLFQVDAWMDRHLAQLPELDSGRAQVCFVRPWQGYYSVDLVQNDPFLRQETIFLKSHGRETEKPFMEQHFHGAVPRSDAPDEAVWYVEREKVDWWKHCDD